MCSTELADVVTGAKTIVLCTPVDAMESIARQMAPMLAPNALITDAGSVKVSVVSALQPILGPRFVGAHPIAGSDQTGLAAARADLYDGATCVVTPSADSPRSAVDETIAFWQCIGCSVVELSPEAHDARLAFTSHLPHVVAAALATVVSQSAPDWMKLVGGGFRDTTRIAASNPELWSGILLANAADVTRSIAEMQELLQQFQQAVESGDESRLGHLFSEARTSRNRLNQEFDGI